MVVQFVRNFLCVVKTLLPPNSSILQQVPFADASKPYSNVTVNEYLIASTQLAAVYFCVRAGYDAIITSLNDIKKYGTLLRALDMLALHPSDLIPADSTGSPEFTLLRHYLQKNLQSAWVGLIVGVCEAVIGVSFTFLAGNSLHQHGPTHPKPLMDALIMMELALVYLLYVMMVKLLKSITQAVRAVMLADRLFTIASSASSNTAAVETSGRQLHDSSGPLTKMDVLLIASEIGYLEDLTGVLGLLQSTGQSAGEGGAGGFELQSVRQASTVAMDDPAGMMTPANFQLLSERLVNDMLYLQCTFAETALSDIMLSATDATAARVISPTVVEAATAVAATPSRPRGGRSRSAMNTRSAAKRQRCRIPADIDIDTDACAHAHAGASPGAGGSRSIGRSRSRGRSPGSRSASRGRARSGSRDRANSRNTSADDARTSNDPGSEFAATTLALSQHVRMCAARSCYQAVFDFMFLALNFIAG